MAMKTEFACPHKARTVSVRITTDTIGPGNSGAKRAGVRLAEPLLDSEGGFGCLPHTGITPLFFHEFLGRAGASHENPESALAIKSVPFNTHELDAMRLAMDPFTGLYIAIRSDECTAAGCGLWASRFLLADGSGEALEACIQAVRDILASEFSREVTAFKKRTGLPMGETPGAIFMPVDVAPLAGASVYTTPLHANTFTDFACNDTLVQMGMGLGGGNSRYSATRLPGDVNAFYAASVAESVMDAEGFVDGRKCVLYQNQYCQITEKALEGVAAGYPLHFGRLIKGFEELGRHGKRQRYYELSYSGERWCVVQASDVELGHVEQPEVSKTTKVLKVGFGMRSDLRDFSVGVSGRKVVESDKVLRVGISSAQRKTLALINGQLSGYVLVLEAPLETLASEFSFADYSNAGAIMCNQVMAVRSAMSHVSGALREAGIIVLEGEIGREFLGSLERMKMHERKMLLYANDEREEGFACAL
jgi:hypothetical protein